MGKRRSQRLEEEEIESSQESANSQMQRRMEQFDSQQSWSDLDQLQNQLFNGTHEISSPQDIPQKSKKKDRQKQRQQEIAQYEQALKISLQQNTTFVNPFGQYNLNVDRQQYLNMVIQVLQKQKPSQGVVRMLGVKSMRILHHEKLFIELGMIKSFLQQLEIPQHIMDNHKILLKSKGYVLHKLTDQQSLQMVQQEQF